MLNIKRLMNESDLPEYMVQGMENYVNSGVRPGGFLSVLLSNDLIETFSRADSENKKVIEQWVVFAYNYLPSDCWGSSKKVDDWIDKGGYNIPPYETK